MADPLPAPGRSAPAALARWACLLLLVGVLLLAWPGIFGPGPAGGSEAPYRFRPGPASDLDARIAFLEERVRIAPDRALERAALAAVYVTKARHSFDGSWWTKAEEAAKTSLASLPVFNLEAKLVLADVAQAGHDFETAIRLAGEVLRDKPRHPAALALLVKCLLAVGRLEEAAATADTLVDRLPSLGSYALRGLVAHARGQEREALFEFRAAFRSEDIGEAETSAWARTMLGRIHAEHGRRSRARDLYVEALRILPGYPTALGLWAELELREGRHEEAARLAHEAFRVAEDPAWLMIEARVHDAAGHSGRAGGARRRAEDILRRALAGGRFGHRSQLARLLLEQGDDAKVAEALGLAQEEARQRKTPETADTLAWALCRAGRWEEARMAVREGLRSGVRDARLFKRAAAIEDHLENYARARHGYLLAVETDPADEEARAALDEYEEDEEAPDWAARLEWAGIAALIASLVFLTIGLARARRTNVPA